VRIKKIGQRTFGLSWMPFRIGVGKLSYRKTVDREHRERVGEVLCCVGGGERDDGSGREELGWVEEEKQEVITAIEKVPKSDRDNEDIWKTVPLEDLPRSDIGEAVKLLKV